MAKRNNTFKAVVVKENPVQSLVEAGINSLTLEDGRRAVAIGNTLFPNHDESIVALILKYIEDAQIDVVFLLGHIVDEDAFRALVDEEKNFVHRFEDAPEVKAAQAAGSFEKRVLALGKSCGDFIRRFAASGATVIYIPSWVNLGLPNEADMMEELHFKKKFLDSWTANHPDAADRPSDLMMSLPTEIDELFGIDGLDNIQVLPYGAAVLVNDKTMFMVGSFRRRHAGDAALVEWEQRGYSLVRSVDGKSASAWQTDSEHTMPEPVLNSYQVHEVGKMWDDTRNGHLGDYHRRSKSFWAGQIAHDVFFGEVVPVERGNDDRRTFVVEGVPYTEETPGCMPNGKELKLAARKSKRAGSSTASTGARKRTASSGSRRSK